MKIGLDGVQINTIAFPGDKYIHPKWGTLGGSDPDHLEKVKKELQKNELFAEVDARGVEHERLKEVIEVAHKIGADVIHTYISYCGDLEEEHRSAPEKVKQILPLLKKYRIKLAIENYEYETADEIVDVIKK